ncbi:MAG: metalloregulator ArsR/SmtB family transcription factor [Chitinophagales bacterium]
MLSAASELFSEKDLALAVSILRAVAHPLRMQLIEFIAHNPGTNVNKIYNTLKLEQSVTSQHLKILRDAGLVVTERKGKFIFYSVNYILLATIEKSVNEFLAS